MLLTSGLSKNITKLGLNTSKSLLNVRWKSTEVATKTLFVANLPWATKPVEIHDLFSDYGPLRKFAYPVDEVGRFKGFAFVTLDGDLAEKAAQKLNLYPLGENYITVKIATDKPKSDKPSKE